MWNNFLTDLSTLKFLLSLNNIEVINLFASTYSQGEIRCLFVFPCGNEERKQNNGTWGKCYHPNTRAQDISLLRIMISIGAFLYEFMKHPGLTMPWAFENHILHGLSKGLAGVCMYMPWSFKPNELIPVQGHTGFSLIITLWVCFRLCWVQLCASATSHVQYGSCELKVEIPNKQTASFILGSNMSREK